MTRASAELALLGISGVGKFKMSQAAAQARQEGDTFRKKRRRYIADPGRIESIHQSITETDTESHLILQLFLILLH